MSDKKKYTVKTPNPNFTGMRNGVQFTDGKGEATEEQARNLVDIWGYDCRALDADTKADVKGEKSNEEPDTITDTIGEEEVEMVEQDGVLYADPKNTNAALKAFMEHHEIAIDSEDIKEDLNEKIAGWVASQAANDES